MKTIVVFMLIALSLPTLLPAHRVEAQTRSVSVKTGVVEPERTGVAWEDTKAPDFTLADLDGHSVSLSSLRGKVVLISFWASWCPFCVQDMPLIDQLQKEYGKQGLVVMGINLEDAGTARAFMKAHGYNFKTVVDADDQVSQLYEIEVLPTVIVIGRDGNIATRLMGAKSKSTLTEAIASAGVKTDSRDAE